MPSQPPPLTLTEDNLLPKSSMKACGRQNSVKPVSMYNHSLPEPGK
jgi:hypothetical protein